MFVDLINASLQFSYIPSSWKLAYISMILKPMKNPNQPLSYRPISLLSTLAKLMERVIQSRLLDWTKKNNIISIYQSGFSKIKSTYDHIFRILQDGTQAFNKNMMVGAIFIDLEKAFDRVWHHGLIYKISELGIPKYLGAWIKNYLENRTFQVKVDGVLSSKKTIRAGVPQGSIIGPLLFNIYFNSIASEITKNRYTKLALYADDLATWIASPYIKIINKQLQLVLNNIHTWMLKWQMVVSINKTVITLFNRGGHHTRINKLNFSLSYNGVNLKIENNPKFLGITLDPGLHLHKNTEKIVSRAKKRLNMLRKLKGSKWGVSSSLIIITFKILIRSIIDYAAMTLPLLSATSLTKLEVIQRQAIRIAYRCPLYTTCEQMLQISSLDSIFDRSITLIDNFFIKSLRTNHSLVANQLQEYAQFQEVLEGAICNVKPRKTLLGALLKTNQSKAIDYLAESDFSENTHVNYT